jgi:hypothetical protein
MMTKGGIVFLYRAMSAEDQQTFKRWLKGNLTAVPILAAVALVVVVTNGASGSLHEAHPVAARAAQHGCVNPRASLGSSSQNFAKSGGCFQVIHEANIKAE